MAAHVGKALPSSCSLSTFLLCEVGALTECLLAVQGRHEVLSLRSAMVQFYKLENFATAAIFARRLLEKSQTTAQVHSCRHLCTIVHHVCLEAVDAQA